MALCSSSWYGIYTKSLRIYATSKANCPGTCYGAEKSMMPNPMRSFKHYQSMHTATGTPTAPRAHSVRILHGHVSSKTTMPVWLMPLTPSALSYRPCMLNSSHPISVFRKGLSHDGTLLPSSNPSSSASDNANDVQPPLPLQKPLTVWDKFKDMYRKYWYVLIPVHGLLSIVFMLVLYYLVQSGIDVVPLLEKLGVPETIIAPVKKSGAGAYIAAAYALYHVISPLRYAVTLASTTVAITYLKRWGYVKPVPSPGRMKEIYKESRQKVQVLSRRLTSSARRYKIKSTRPTDK